MQFHFAAPVTVQAHVPHVAIGVNPLRSYFFVHPSHPGFNFNSWPVNVVAQALGIPPQFPAGQDVRGLQGLQGWVMPMTGAVNVYSQERRNRFRVGAIWNNVGESSGQFHTKVGFKISKWKTPVVTKVFGDLRLLSNKKDFSKVTLLLLF